MNYRKFYQEHHNLSDEQMEGMDVHHIDGDRNNNDISNLQLLTPEEHAKIHEHDFVRWARIGAKLGQESLRKRIKEKGLTEAELKAKREAQRKAAKARIGTKHSEESIEKMKETLSDGRRAKENHLKWGQTTYEVVDPNGEKHIVSGGWCDWCREKGIEPQNLRNVALGKRKHANGYKAKIL